MDLFQPNFQSSGKGGGSEAAFSVTDLTRHLAALVRHDEILQDVWVRGELSNFTRAGSGHLYFSLKDEGACISCVMWRSAAIRVPFQPASGMQLIAHGQLDVYLQRGQYQLVVDGLVADGAGARHLALEQAKARLLAEGLLDPARKRAIPRFPIRVAVVTSLHGAAVRDVCVTLRSRPQPLDVILVPALVQGEGAVASLCAAMRLANHCNADVIILARGGGSLEDLWCFNSEDLARAIAGSRLPVVSGVGHETDFSLADLVADHRAATPTAAAELVAAMRDDLIERADYLAQRARSLLAARLENAELRLSGVQRRAPLAHPLWMVERKQQHLDELQSRLLRARHSCLQQWQHRLALAAGKLEGLSPLATLARGYALVTRLPEEAPLSAVAQVVPGDPIRIRLADGALDAEVKHVSRSSQDE